MKPIESDNSRSNARRPMATLHRPALRIAARVARLVPTTWALALARDWRDAADLGAAEVALVSFPKSGRTFVRVMMARLYRSRFGHPDTDLLRFSKLLRADSGLPRLVFTHDGDAMRKADEISADKTAYAHCKVALLARHPADVAVSRYSHLKHRSRDAARKRLAAQPIADFIWTPQGGIPSIVAFLNGWAHSSRIPRDFTLLRYEAFRSDPHATLTILARFCDLASTETEIAEAVEFARLENLKEREREGYFASDRIGQRHESVAESSKVRSGKVGGFRQALSADEVARVEDYVDAHLDRIFGYGR